MAYNRLFPLYFMKKILCVFLTIIIISSIIFQCSLNASAVIAVDDAILIGCAVGISLISMGITMQNTSEFFTTDTWSYMAQDISGDVDQFLEDVTIGANNVGDWLLSVGDKAWNALTNWITRDVEWNGNTGTREFEVVRPSHPTTITLDNGVVVPWAEWMQRPFFIYELPSNSTIFAWYCTGTDVGCNIATQKIRVWCTGTGKTYRYTLTNGQWADPVEHNMNYGLSYKDTTGSFYDLNFGSQYLNGNTVPQIIQYRTMDLVFDNGNPQEQSPPNEVPSTEGSTTYSVTLEKTDATKFPGAVDAPVEEIADGEAILFEVPEGLIVDADTANPSITNDPAVVSEVLEELTPSDVKPRVKTDQYVDSGTIDQIITNTADPSLPGNSNSIETANKFKLPKSFLEGFPFSIPYSVYVGIQSFVADPEPPKFKLPFSIPRLGINENVEIDLTPWNPVAKLCRALLSVVWVAGLAMACGKFIKR